MLPARFHAAGYIFPWLERLISRCFSCKPNHYLSFWSVLWIWLCVKLVFIHRRNFFSEIFELTCKCCDQIWESVWVFCLLDLNSQMYRAKKYFILFLATVLLINLINWTTFPWSAPSLWWSIAKIWPPQRIIKFSPHICKSKGVFHQKSLKHN